MSTAASNLSMQEQRDHLARAGIPVCEPRDGRLHPDAAYQPYNEHWQAWTCPHCGILGFRPVPEPTEQQP